MAALPRVRQLRRDKTVFTLAMNTVRLHLEEADRINQRPELRATPDADLLLIQQNIDQWVGLTTSYLMRKFRCSATQAIHLLGELQAELKAVVPVDELRAVPYQRALSPASLAQLAAQQQAAEQQSADEPQPAADEQPAVEPLGAASTPTT